jgi:hypothetical protein
MVQGEGKPGRVFNPNQLWTEIDLAELLLVQEFGNLN